MPRKGNNVNLPITGIRRSKPTNSDDIGACSEIMNLRQKGGAWVVSLPKKLQQTITDVKEVYFHVKLDANQAIVLKDYSGTDKLVFWGGSTVNLAKLDFALNAGEEIIDYKELGNYVTFTTNQRQLNFLWDGTKYEAQEYVQLGNFGVSFNYGDTTTIADSGVDSSRVFTLLTRAETKKIEHNDNDYFVGTSLFRWALKLKDGRYIYQSAPKIMTSYEGTVIDFGGTPDVPSNTNYEAFLLKFGDGTNNRTNVIGRKIKYAIGNSADILQYKDLISSVVLCVTRPYNAILDADRSRMENEDLEGDSSSSQKTRLQSWGFRVANDDSGNTNVLYLFPSYPDAEKNKPYTVEDADFFIAKEIKMDDLIDGEVEFKGNELGELSQKGQLVLDTTRYSEELIGGEVDVYNKRTHLFLYERKLQAFFREMFAPVSTGIVEYFSEATVIEGNREYKITTPLFTGGLDGVTVDGGYLSYPNLNCKSIRIIQKNGSVYKDSIINPNIHKSDNLVYAYNIERQWEQFRPVLIDAFTTTTDTTTDYNQAVEHDNDVIVSEQNYPLSYESRNSYPFGDGNIIGLSAPTFPLSEGQFGGFPLYVFTTKGVWALANGSGEVLYGTSNPVSREVAIGRGAISGSEIGIIFASRDGLNILNGSLINPLSLMLQGKPNSFFDDVDYKLYIGQPNIPEDTTNLYLSYPSLYQFIDDVDFLDYISDNENIIVGYAYGKGFKEVIISNTKRKDGFPEEFEYKYSYVFDIMTKEYHKISEVWDSFDDQFPELYAITKVGNDVVIHNASEEEGEHNTVMIQTRPQLFDSERFKKIYRSIVRTYSKAFDFAVPPNPNNPLVNCKTTVFMVMVSLDSKTWTRYDVERKAHELTADELDKAYVDFRIPGGITKDLYFRYFFVGELTKDSSVSGLAVEADEVEEKMIE